jgi:adenine-specific DNA-methyltransferase
VSKKKDLGQVFTPEWVVELMLDELGYSDDVALNSRVLEPSCGEGVFLVAAAKRIILAGRQAQLSDEVITSHLAENLHGVEYDDEVLQTTRKNLDELAAHYGIQSVEWNLTHSDALLVKGYGSYDFVIGNPPYIRVHNMDDTLRAHVKQFAMSTGTTDLYIIFFELGLKWLNAHGKLAYIAPNSWLKNASQKSFREEVINNKKLHSIINYGAVPVFGKEASTYTAITILDNASQMENVRYIENGIKEPWTSFTSYTDFDNYTGEPLSFVSPADQLFMHERKRYKRFLGDLSNIQNGVATLRDKAFLGAPVDAESAITLPVVKASTYKGETLTKRILFPYIADGDRIRGLSEEELTQHEKAYKYLLTHKDDLETRDSDKSALWFHYGRSQGIGNMLKEKLVFSHVVHPDQTTIKAFILPMETVVYSGLFVTAIPDGLSLEQIKEVIESEDFCRYVKLTGKDMSGSYKTFGAKNVKSFTVQ